MKRLEEMTIGELAALSENAQDCVNTLRHMSDKVLCALSTMCNAEMARRWKLLQGVTPAPEE